MPKIELYESLGPLQCSEMTENCKDGELPEVATDIKQRFASTVLSLKGYFFDQPSGARLIIGLLESINSHSLNQATSSFMELSLDRALVALNCLQSDLKNFRDKKADKDIFEFGLGGNVFDILYPSDVKIDRTSAEELILKAKNSD